MKVIYNYYDGTTYLLFNDDEEWPEGDWTEVAPPPVYTNLITSMEKVDWNIKRRI